MTFYPLFPNIVHYIEIKDFGKIQDELVDFVYNEENENPVGQIFSNRGGWQSNPYYHESENILFSTLNKHIRNYFSTTEVGLNGVTSQWTGLDMTTRPDFEMTTPGAAFQFTEHYQGPGLSNHTIIQRTTTINSVTDTTSTFTQ